MGETIVAKVDARGRVQLSKAIIEALNINSGDLIRITVEKITPMKSES
ncbi:MAG: AbrB/MazE/SpoVT family DNA-binding domain-containing protein [Methanotrichaceae archaeon]